MQLIDPAVLARQYLDEVSQSLADLATHPRVIGLIATRDKPSMTYAIKARQLFNEVGFSYELREHRPDELEGAILRANDDPEIHGIFVYFPVFRNGQDTRLRNLVHYTKDIEAGSEYWTSKLYTNDRLASSGDRNKKALLPCTPLAIVKILAALGEYGSGEKPMAGRTVTIFNRSEIIGRPLAMMLSNDGAAVYSFDDQGPLRFIEARPRAVDIGRREALAAADIVISGVPNPGFALIQPAEVQASAVCVNFASIRNYDPDICQHARMFVPRVGPMTLAMCMRNTIRLYRNRHHD